MSTDRSTARGGQGQPDPFADRRFDPGLYLVTDRRMLRGRSLGDLVVEAVRGGVTMVQLREKDAPGREFVQLARELAGRLRPLGIPLVVNDRVDVALAAGADGVHVGQVDMDAADVRRLLGEQAIVGLSVESMAQVEQADGLPVDYLGVSPVFGTPTKTDTVTEWGLEGMARIARISRHPLVGIGGIHAGNAGEVIAAGAHGVAVVSAICAASQPAEAAAELRHAVDRALAQKGAHLEEGGSR